MLSGKKCEKKDLQNAEIDLQEISGEVQTFNLPTGMAFARAAHMVSMPKFGALGLSTRRKMLSNTVCKRKRELSFSMLTTDSKFDEWNNFSFDANVHLTLCTTSRVLLIQSFDSFSEEVQQPSFRCSPVPAKRRALQENARCPFQADVGNTIPVSTIPCKAIQSCGAFLCHGQHKKGSFFFFHCRCLPATYKCEQCGQPCFLSLNFFLWEEGRSLTSEKILEAGLHTRSLHQTSQNAFPFWCIFPEIFRCSTERYKFPFAWEPTLSWIWTFCCNRNSLQSCRERTNLVNSRKGIFTKQAIQDSLVHGSSDKVVQLSVFWKSKTGENWVDFFFKSQSWCRRHWRGRTQRRTTPPQPPNGKTWFLAVLSLLRLFPFSGCFWPFGTLFVHGSNFLSEFCSFFFLLLLLFFYYFYFFNDVLWDLKLFSTRVKNFFLQQNKFFLHWQPCFSSWNVWLFFSALYLSISGCFRSFETLFRHG